MVIVGVDPWGRKRRGERFGRRERWSEHLGRRDGKGFSVSDDEGYWFEVRIAGGGLVG